MIWGGRLSGFRKSFSINGTPDRSRTYNLLIRSQVLYPIELRVPEKIIIVRPKYRISSKCLKNRQVCAEPRLLEESLRPRDSGKLLAFRELLEKEPSTAGTDVRGPGGLWRGALFFRQPTVISFVGSAGRRPGEAYGVTGSTRTRMKR